jgi:hypothetical protein
MEWNGMNGCGYLGKCGGGGAVSSKKNLKIFSFYSMRRGDSISSFTQKD